MNLGRRFQESFQAIQILYSDFSSIYFQQSFSLKAHEVSRNQFTHRSKLICQFLMSCRQLKLDSEIALPTFILREFEQCGD